MQSINSIETFAHETGKDLARKKDEIKRNSLMKQYKIVYITTSIISQRKVQKNIIQIRTKS